MSTCERCGCSYNPKENAFGVMGGHSPNQCIAALKALQADLLGTIREQSGLALQYNQMSEKLIEQKERTRMYATKWFELFINELEHDIDQGVIMIEDLEPYLSQIAALLKRA